MPTRAPSVRRPLSCLAVVLALILGLTPRAGAKPPDLPTSIIPDCAPDNGPPAIALEPGVLDEEPQESNEGLSMADRCAAMRTFSRCVLFALHPLSAVVRPDRCCEFDEEPPYPVVRVGNSEVSMRDLVLNAAAVCGGPFFRGPKASATTAPTCPAGGMTPPRNYCPQTHECPDEMKCPAGSETPSDPENEARAAKAQELMIAAQIATHIGDLETACSYYRMICELCPGTCCAWEAGEHIRSLRARIDGSATEDKQEEEQNVCPSVKRAAEWSKWCAKACECCAQFFKELRRVPATPAADPDKALQERLKGAVNIDCTDRPLREVLDDLRTRYKINIFVDMLNLQKENISLDGPVTIKLEQVSLKSALNLTVSQLDLEARVKEGVVFVTTAAAARGPLVPKVYAVADLLKVKKGKTSNADAAKEAAKIICLIKNTVAPRSWSLKSGQATVAYFPRKRALVVSQDMETHEQVADLLQALRQLHDKDMAGVAEESEPFGPVITSYDLSDLMNASDTDRNETSTTEVQRDTEIIRAEHLMKVIKTTIAPERWIAGDAEALEYNAATKALIVRQPEEIQERIAALLAALRNQPTSSSDSLPPLFMQQAEDGEEPSVAPIPTPALSEASYLISDLLVEYKIEWDRKTDKLSVITKTVDPSELIHLIEEGVAPESWTVNGGQGKIECNRALDVLTIQQTAEVQKAVREFLDARRHEIELHKKECERQVQEKGCKVKPESKQGGPFGVWGSGREEVDASSFQYLRRFWAGPADCPRGANTAFIDVLTVDPPETFAKSDPCPFGSMLVGGSRFGTPELVRGEKLTDDVSRLLDDCHQALKEGRLAEAEMFASRALCLDPVRLRLDPMIYRMQFLDRVLNRAVTLQPLLPGIDFNIVRAYNEILGMAPPRLLVEIHEAGGEEECEDGPRGQAMPRLFLEQEAGDVTVVTAKDKDGNEASMPSVCFDIDPNKGRVRCQLQGAFGTLRFLRDEDGHNSVEFSLP